MDHRNLSHTLEVARPTAIAALSRYFRDLDDAEDAFQEACFRAMKNWPKKGAPRDPVAWLIFVGKNIALDEKRKTKRLTPLPDEDLLVEDTALHDESMEHAAENQPYGDDTLRLLFLCCHPSLSFEQQVTLCLKVIVGFTIEEIASAFLAKPPAIAQRITRAKRN